MKIEKITDNKIRIILNLDDLKEKNIDLHSFMSNSIESQNLFIDMLDEAEKTVGFYVKDSKVLIEALASAEGLFVFTITKVEDDSPKKRTIRIKRKVSNTNYKKAIYMFDSFEEFCSFCTYLNDSNFSNLKSLAKSTSLYTLEDKYYLVISNINIDFLNIKGFFAAISEFAKAVNHPEEFESKLFEYGNPIMKRNAIKRCLYYFG